MRRGHLRFERQKKCLALMKVEMEWMSPLIENDNIVAFADTITRLCGFVLALRVLECGIGLIEHA